MEILAARPVLLTDSTANVENPSLNRIIIFPRIYPVINRMIMCRVVAAVSFTYVRIYDRRLYFPLNFFSMKMKTALSFVDYHSHFHVFTTWTGIGSLSSLIHIITRSHHNIFPEREYPNCLHMFSKYFVFTALHSFQTIKMIQAQDTTRRHLSINFAAKTNGNFQAEV